jgi:transposase
MAAAAEPARQLEGRRLKAIELLAAGSSLGRVAAELCVSREAVRKWRKAYEEGGRGALYARPRRGPPRRISLRVLRRRLPALLLAGASYDGFADEEWTATRVAALIEREFGVRYTAGYAWRLLVEGIGWTAFSRAARVRKPASDSIS